MTTNAADLRRIVVRAGAERIDIAVPADTPLVSSLNRFGFRTAADAHTIGLDGRRIDLRHPPSALPDGALLTVVAATSTATAAERRLEQRRKRLRPFDSPHLVWGAGALAVTAITAATLLPESAGTPAERIVRLAAAALVAVTALFALLAVTAPERSALPARAVAAPVLLAFTAGFLAADTAAARAGDLATAIGLFAAAVTAALLGLLARGRPGAGAAASVFVLALLLGTLWAGVLLVDWPTRIAAAVAAGAAPLALRLIPSLSLDVPDGHLIEQEASMSTRWTVRGRPEPAPGPLREGELIDVVGGARERLVTATALLTALPPLVLPLVLMTASADRVTAIATLVFTLFLALSLCLTPRTASGRLAKWAPRAAAGALVLELAVATALWLPEAALLLSGALALLLGLGTLALVVPIARGFRSLQLSRTGDIVQGIVTGLALPVACVAAGLIPILQGVATR